jgi:hypothetical protein
MMTGQTHQQRRHLELTTALGRVAEKREDAIRRLGKLDAQLQTLKRSVARSGKRLAEVREAMEEVVPIAPPAPPPPEVAPVTARRPRVRQPVKPLAPEGDVLTGVIDAASKAERLRNELRGERQRKRH